MDSSVRRRPPKAPEIDTQVPNRHLPATEFQTHAAKAIWDFEGIYATSRHIPGVRFAGIPHPGIIGTAPSHELLQTWNERETGLIKEVGERPGPPVAAPPEPKGAYVGQDLPDEVRERIYREGARTIPGREHGGNCDVRVPRTCLWHLSANVVRVFRLRISRSKSCPVWC